MHLQTLRSLNRPEGSSGIPSFYNLLTLLTWAPVDLSHLIRALCASGHTERVIKMPCLFRSFNQQLRPGSVWKMFVNELFFDRSHQPSRTQKCLKTSSGR